MTPKMLRKVLGVAIRNRHNILITSRPGMGKTAIMKQSCADEAADYVLFIPGVKEPTDISGYPFVSQRMDGNTITAKIISMVTNGKPASEEELRQGIGEVLGAAKAEAEFIPFGDVLKLIKATKKTVCIIDDLGQAMTAVQAALMQLIYGGELNGIRISEHIAWLAASNRREDFAGVQGIIEPVKSRFLSIINLEDSADDLVDWGKDNGFPGSLLAYIKWKGNSVFEWKPTQDMVNSPCSRTIEAVAKIITTAYPKEVIWELISGAAGSVFAHDFRTFIDIRSKLPDPDECLRNPSGVQLPAGRDKAMMYALAGALISRVNYGNFPNAVTLVRRMPREFNIFLIDSVIRQQKVLMKHPSWKEWAAENTDYIMPV
jgi:hypothetical protein